MLCAATLFLSCSKDNDNKGGGGNSGFQWDKGKVFVGGAEKNTDDKYVAKLWIDGKEKSLSDKTQNAQVLDVAATATKVYAAGTDGDKGVLWTNGVAKVLTATGSTGGRASAVFVSGEDVYVATREITSAGSLTVKLWKNGVEEYVLSQGKAAAMGNSIFVSGADVYVAGVEMENSLFKAVLWKNGSPTFLTETVGKNGDASDVIVYGSDVYIAGTEGDDAVLWKNTKDNKTVLDTGNAMTGIDIFVNALSVETNGAINVVGSKENQGMLWVKPTTGAVSAAAVSGFFNVSSIAFSGSDIYMTGISGTNIGESTGIAKIYKNGVTKDLTDGQHRSYANSVFVR